MSRPKIRYIAEDFVERRFDEIVAYLNARSENGFELISVIRFTNHYGIVERYFWRITLAEDATNG